MPAARPPRMAADRRKRRWALPRSRTAPAGAGSLLDGRGHRTLELVGRLLGHELLRLREEGLRVLALHVVVAKRGLAVVDLVQHDVVRVVLVVQHIELPAARLLADRGFGVDGDGLVEFLEAFRLDLELDD